MAQTRPYRIRLQYRIGTSGTFQDVPGPVEYVANETSGHSQLFTTILPAAVNNQQVVELRWKYYQEGTGSGARPQLRIDDIAITTSESPHSGTGTAYIEQNVLRGGELHNIEVTVIGVSDTVSLTHVDITLPEWVSTIAPENIHLSQQADSVIVDGNTARIVGVDVTSSNPLEVQFLHVDVPDQSGEFPVVVKTGAGTSETVSIANQPALYIWSTPMSIAGASSNNTSGVAAHLGEWVTINGVITVADQFETSSGEKGPSFIQDATGGMSVFSPAGVATRVTIGEEVTLLGKVDQFNGLNQLDTTAIVVDRHGTGNTIEPLVVTASQLSGDGAGGVEQYEGRLVRINGVTVNTFAWNVSGAGTNYQLTDATGVVDVRINRAVDFANTTAPAGQFDIVGVVSQFKTSSPFIGGYQLQPRFSADILSGSSAPPIVSLPPYESSATSSSITLSWQTAGEATSEVRYGLTTAYEIGTMLDETPKSQHAMTIAGLQPATIYQVQLRSAAGSDTAKSGNYIVVTRSPAGATQQISVYFNKSVDYSVMAAESAKTINFLTHLRNRIQIAGYSIDIALYSLSGSVGASIATDLIAAKNRGVRVRVIGDHTQTTAPYNTLVNNGVAVIRSNFGTVNAGREGIHHNKFAVFDLLGPDPQRVFVIMGSWNPTDPGTNEHHQNIVEFQDVSIAAAFTREFEQMWGSSTETPNPGTSRFGANKVQVAPTVFWIGDASVRLFFSPQGFGQYGRTEQQIIGALQQAGHSINLGINLITRQTIADVMKQKFDQGVKVRGVIGEVGTSGSVYAFLKSWADVYDFGLTNAGLLHHKYAIIDGETSSATSMVITGSHNWSLSANERNDENTV
ncbi:MAG: phospholipase D-like domain-containing protein, partial [Bacteroidota bacterium]